MSRSSGRRSPVGDALERFVAEGQDYKVELIEDLVRNQGVQTVSLYTNGAVHRPLPRPARAEHEADQGVQAAVGRRRLLARGLDQADADARLWDRLLLGQGARGVPRAARAGARRTTIAGSARSLGCSRSRRSRPGRRSGCPAAPRCSTRSCAQPRDGSRARLHRGQDTASCSTARSGRPRATGRSTARTCS